MPRRRLGCMAESAVIEISGLVKSFKGHLGLGRKVAVSGLDLSVGRGEIFGLLGPNGAGKTTTLKAMIGLLRPDAGSVRLFGRPPSDVSARARIGFLPENPYFYDYLTAPEFLDFYGRLHGFGRAERRRRVEATLERVGLDAGRSQALRKFSKGMVQRLGLAQAILHDPDLVILDEPMSGLDPIGRREVRDLILELREAGKTVFFSSHILQDAELICDRVGIVVEGRLRHLGVLDQMVRSKPRWFEVAVRGQVPSPWDREVASASGEKVMVKVPDVAELGRLLAAVAESPAEVVSVWPRRESLEDLFMKEVARER
ncbi:MAG: ABC transporter ATP-binding protein [Acidobacteria bacterium]|uniref:ABC transporter ATP-binding protein n=1 Tax=Candidatus Polarisedimenticola svalbardensis TaxID=2886004 RepID=A0A8J7C2T2_9BACT|nr:ABC transporter ATP-binding protein [Candidatus Polarisedimenticola svalbardensis]